MIETNLLETLANADSNFAAVINKDSSLDNIHLILKLFQHLIGRIIQRIKCILICDGNYHSLYLYLFCFHYEINYNIVSKTAKCVDFIIWILVLNWCGGDAFSADGLNWQYGGTAFTNQMDFTDGTKFAFIQWTYCDGYQVLGIVIPYCAWNK